MSSCNEQVSWYCKWIQVDIFFQVEFHIIVIHVIILKYDFSIKSKNLMRLIYRYDDISYIIYIVLHQKQTVEKYMNKYIYIYIYVYMYVCIYICMYAGMYAHIYVYMNLCIFIHIYILGRGMKATKRAQRAPSPPQELEGGVCSTLNLIFSCAQ